MKYILKEHSYWFLQMWLQNFIERLLIKESYENTNTPFKMWSDTDSNFVSKITSKNPKISSKGTIGLLFWPNSFMKFTWNIHPTRLFGPTRLIRTWEYLSYILFWYFDIFWKENKKHSTLYILTYLLTYLLNISIE